MSKELESESPEVRAAASAELVSRRHVENGSIAAVVEKYLAVEGRQGTVKDNMLLLGKLRAVEYVPLLVRNLTFEAFYKNTKRPQPPDDLYPAVRALIDIGSPALQPVLERLMNEDDETVARAGAVVLLGILGRRSAHGVLTEEIRVGNASTQQRLQRVLHLIDELP